MASEPSRLLPLRLDQVGYRVQGRLLLQDLSAEIGAGTRTVILGPNGAGKTLLMRICHGLITPTAGRVLWAAPALARSPGVQAMVFQRPVMLRRSVLSNVLYGLALQGHAREARVACARDVLERVGLAPVARRAARFLSIGEQQRLALARVWALRPQVLFLDEPTASLDPGATREVEDIIAAIHSSGTKIIMTTHNLGQARRLADEILFIHQGRLVERTDAAVFFKNPVSSEAAAFIKGELPW